MSDKSLKPKINVNEFLKKIASQDDEGLILHNDFVAGRLYWFLVMILVVMILVLGVVTAKSIQDRHQLYQELTLAKNEEINLKNEEQRLLIEQQTFSAIPTVARRAVVELGMFYPSDDNRIIITIP